MLEGVFDRTLRGFLRAAPTCAAVLLLGSAFPAASASAASTAAASPLTIRINATTLADVAVAVRGGPEVVCNPGSMRTGPVACTNSVNLTGHIRTTHNGTGTLSLTLAPVTGADGNTLDPAAIEVTCSDNDSRGAHGAATFATGVHLSPAGRAQCASWAGPDVFTYNVTLTFAIDAGQGKADTYTLSRDWTLVAEST
jgi:hypothetical protein